MFQALPVSYRIDRPDQKLGSHQNPIHKTLTVAFTLPGWHMPHRSSAASCRSTFANSALLLLLARLQGCADTIAAQSALHPCPVGKVFLVALDCMLLGPRLAQERISPDPCVSRPLKKELSVLRQRIVTGCRGAANHRDCHICRHRIEARALPAVWWLIPCDRVLQARTSGKQSR